MDGDVRGRCERFMMFAMVETDPASAWPRLLRPLVRRGWVPRGYRRGGDSNYLPLMMILIAPYAVVVALFVAPIWLTYLVVRWALRRVGALDDLPR
jgi:hypothetical protein